MIDNIGYSADKVNPGMGNYAAGQNAVGKPGEADSNKPAGAGEINRTNGIEECQTCSTRRYQDGSDDPGVSFKSPTALNPAQAATAVYGHEREHYVREEENAEREGKEVLSNKIVLFSDVCPECGKTYVSGGETTTVTRSKAESAEFAKDFFEKTVGAFLPKIIDVKA